MVSKVIGFIISLTALFLPWRLRVLFSEILGWVTQFIYMSYYGTLNFLLKELKKGQEENSIAPKEQNHDG